MCAAYSPEIELILGPVKMEKEDLRERWRTYIGFHVCHKTNLSAIQQQIKQPMQYIHASSMQ